ncbi:flavin reductase family protein [uncultured Merdimonas sp.]|jgi:flavin reductase (DIM6/NTAB) family NADH-FMN oxidoreductase RutF|uniref:flavin reductase family protein n=1 Tax=uncultured Merdimonas sp. TaxID=2023269 RepID=UPI0032083A99
MGKQIWKPGNMLYPLPAVLVSAADKKGEAGILTVAWTGTICTNPAMLYISVKPERYTYHMIRETGEFVVNLTTKKLARVTDWCGVRSGRDVDKWEETGLTKGRASRLVYAPLIEESPVNLECQVTEVKELGSHHMFLARILAVQADEAYMNENGKFELNETGLIAYSHGEYFSLGEDLGRFGFSVKKK